MVEYYTQPPEFRYPNLETARSGGSNGTAQAIAQIGESAVKIGTLFAEGRKRGKLNDYSLGMTDQMLGALNEGRANEGLPPLQPSEIKSLTDYNVQLRKLRTAEAQAGVAKSLRHRVMAYHYKAKTDNPGLALEFEQLFGAHTGMSFGAMAFDSASMKEDHAVNEALDPLSTPDVKFQVKKAEATSAIEIAINEGWDTEGVSVSDLIDRARKEKATAFNINRENALIGLESNRIGLKSQEEQFRMLMDPAYAAGREVTKFVVEKFDTTFPNERNIPLEAKRERVGGLLQSEWAANITRNELAAFQAQLELDPAKRAEFVVRRSVEEIYAKHAGLQDARDVPYSDKFKFVKEQFQQEWLVAAEKLHDEVKASYPEGRLQLAVEDDAINRWRKDFGMTQGVEIQRMLDHHATATALEGEASRLQLQAQNAEAKEKVAGAMLTQVEVPRIISNTTQALDMFIEERMNDGISPEEAEEIALQAQSLLRDASTVITSHPGYATARQAANAQIKILENLKDVAVSFSQGDYTAEAAKNRIEAFRAVNDYKVRTSVINPGAPQDAQITGQDVLNSIDTISWWTADMDNAPGSDQIKSNVELLANIFSRQNMGLNQAVEGGAATFSDAAQAYRGMETNLIRLLNEKGVTPETVGILDNIVSNFITQDYEYYSTRGDGIPADQLKLMGDASIRLLGHPGMKEYFAANPAQGEALKDVLSQFQSVSVDALVAEADKELKGYIDPDRVSVMIPRPPFGIEAGVKTSSLIDTDLSGDYFKFTPKYKTLAAFKTAMKGKVINDSDEALNSLYIKVNAMSTRLNRNLANRFQQIAMVRSTYNNIPMSQALQEMYKDGLGIFDPVPEPDKSTDSKK